MQTVQMPVPTQRPLLIASLQGQYPSYFICGPIVFERATLESLSLLRSRSGFSPVYGRIGDPGQTQTKSFATPDAARAEAAKKVGEKTRKGYAPAVEGKRKKRPVTRRSVASRPSECMSASA